MNAPAKETTMPGKHKLATLTPVEGSRHEVPTEAVDTYEGIVLRIQMAGIELGHGARLTRRLSWAITTVTAVTSLAVFATLSLATGMAARVTVGVVVAAAAVLSAWETKASEEARTEAKDLSLMLQDFLPLRRRLAHALSMCRMYGTPIDPDLLSEAQKALDDHTRSRPQEYPAFDKAEDEVVDDLTRKGYLHRAT
ncbi:MAG: hypothetical protein WAV00_10875 [Nocardioides sp.]